MALDVYVGSLTRYYAGRWENLGERAARERGAPTSVRWAKQPEDAKSQDRIRAKVIGWRTALAKALGDRLAGPLDWDETEDAPWYTHRPGWDGFGSLVLWAAYAEHPVLTCPASLPEDWDEDPALARSNGAGFRSCYSHLVRDVELWLPARFAFTVEGQDFEGRRVVFGSAPGLCEQLRRLNAATWQAGRKVLSGWQATAPAADWGLERRARHAFAVLSDLSGKAVAYRLPMKLEY